jgi:hypothetical protein
VKERVTFWIILMGKARGWKHSQNVGPPMPPYFWNAPTGRFIVHHKDELPFQNGSICLKLLLQEDKMCVFFV